MTDPYDGYAGTVAELNRSHVRQQRQLACGAILLGAICLALGIWIGRLM